MAVTQTTLVSDMKEYIILWSGFATSGDVSSAAAPNQFPDKTVQAFGTFTGGMEVTIEGTNDAAVGASNWGVLHDPQGNALVLTDASVKLIAENPLRIRARATAGAGGATVSVAIIGAR